MGDSKAAGDDRVGVIRCPEELAAILEFGFSFDSANLFSIGERVCSRLRLRSVAILSRSFERDDTCLRSYHHLEFAVYFVARCSLPAGRLVHTFQSLPLRGVRGSTMVNGVSCSPGE